MGQRKRQVPRRGGYEKIRAMAEAGCRETDIARALGMSLKTWIRIKDEDPQALDALEEGRGIVHEKLVGKLVEKALAGDTVCLLFALKCMFHYREYAPLDDNPRVSINFQLPGALKPEQYGQLLELEKRRLPRGKAEDETGG